MLKILGMALLLVGACVAQDQDYQKGVKAYGKGEYQEALQHFEKSCKQNNPTACFNLGVMYEYGEGVEKNKLKAIEFYQQACNQGEGAGCASLGVIYEYGMGVKKDTQQAQRFFQKACDLGDQEGCGYLKSSLGH